MIINSIEYYRNAPPDSGMEITDDDLDKVMHAELVICGSRVNMSDGDPDEILTGNRIMLNVFVGESDDVRKAFDVLKADGKVYSEPGPQFFSPMYASVEDRFGVRWQLIFEG